MSQDIFIKLDKIEGESADSKHGKEIDVLSWSWGVSNGGSMAYGGGGGVGKADFSAITFNKNVDKSTPNLQRVCSTLEHIKEATLTCRKAGKTPQEYLIIKMTDVIVTSLQNSASNSDTGVSESVSLHFAKVQVDYKPQKADGTLDGAVTFKYDIKANKEG